MNPLHRMKRTRAGQRIDASSSSSSNSTQLIPSVMRGTSDTHCRKIPGYEYTLCHRSRSGHPVVPGTPYLDFREPDSHSAGDRHSRRPAESDPREKGAWVKACVSGPPRANTSNLANIDSATTGVIHGTYFRARYIIRISLQARNVLVPQIPPPAGGAEMTGIPGTVRR